MLLKIISKRFQFNYRLFTCSGGNRVSSFRISGLVVALNSEIYERPTQFNLVWVLRAGPYETQSLITIKTSILVRWNILTTHSYFISTIGNKCNRCFRHSLFLLQFVIVVLFSNLRVYYHCGRLIQDELERDRILSSLPE